MFLYIIFSPRIQTFPVGDRSRKRKGKEFCQVGEWRELFPKVADQVTPSSKNAEEKGEAHPGGRRKGKEITEGIEVIAPQNFSNEQRAYGDNKNQANGMAKAPGRLEEPDEPGVKVDTRNEINGMDKKNSKILPQKHRV